MPAAQQYNNITSRLVKGWFFETLKDVGSWLSDLAMDADSNQDVETYAGLANIPMLREWVGSRQRTQLREKTLTITNKDWEASIDIATKDLRRDKTGQIRNRIAQLAMRASQHQKKLISQQIVAGDAATYGNAYTGSTYFNSSHVYGPSATNDNTISVDISALPVGDTTGAHGSITAPSVGEIALSIQQGVQQMYGFVDSENEPINEDLMSFIVMVPTTLYAAAKTAVTKDFMAQGMSNPITGTDITYRVIANARLNTWTDKFVVFGSDPIVKPFILQVEVAPSISALAEGSDYEFTNKAHQYAVDWCGNVRYMAPDKAVLVTMT